MGKGVRAFNAQAFLDSAGFSKQIVDYGRDEGIFTQGDLAESVGGGTPPSGHQDEAAHSVISRIQSARLANSFSTPRIRSPAVAILTVSLVRGQVTSPTPSKRL